MRVQFEQAPDCIWNIKYSALSGKVTSPFQAKIKQKNSALMISTMNLEK